jgi:hypothetical protein
LYVAAESSEGDVREPDTHWIAMLGPQVAAPLAAWLRYAAALIDIQFRDYVDPADPDAVRHIEQMHWHPLAVARSILGEET